jgi:hypothetical protein
MENKTSTSDSSKSISQFFEKTKSIIVYLLVELMYSDIPESLNGVV